MLLALIDLNSKVNELSIKNLSHDLWPKSNAVNFLANQRAALQEQGICNPFVHAKMKHFLPIWALEKPADLDNLHVNLWSPAFLRYAVAADAVGMVPLATSLQHHDLCMRITNEHSKTAKAAFLACAYDDALRNLVAEKSKANWNFAGENVFSQIDRDVLDRTLAALDKSNWKSSKQWEPSWAQNKASGQWGQKRKWDDHNKSYSRKHGKY